MPRSELNQKRVRNFRHVFEAGAAVLEHYFAQGSNGSALAPDRALRDGLERRLEAQSTLWQAQLRLHRHYSHAGAPDSSAESLTLAEKAQEWTLILSSALRKANRGAQGEPLNRRLDDHVLSLRRRALRSSIDPHRLGELDRHITIAEERGWRRTDGDTRLLLFIGAMWCADTANVMGVTSSFGIPMHILISDEDNLDETGFFHFNDHAQMLLVAPPGRPGPSVPLVIFPNGYHMTEPRPCEFLMTMVEHGLM
jgi:hypothetical protein